MEEKLEQKKRTERAYWLLGLRIMSDFGLAIAIPVVVLVSIGGWLDRRWGTQPLLIIIAFVLAFAVSSVSVYRKAKKYAEEYKEIEKRQ